MEIQFGNLSLPGIRFPGRAGELQSIGATAALIRELGDNYSEYNTFLAQQAAETGGRPSPADFRDDPSSYAKASDLVWQILVAEAILRRCRSYRLFGEPLDQMANPEIPFVDDRHRRLSVETGQAALPDAAGSSSAVTWQPPPMPWANRG